MRITPCEVPGRQADLPVHGPTRARCSEQLARVARLAVRTRDGERLLQEIPKVVVDALHVDRAVVYLHEEGCAQLRAAAAFGLLPPGRFDTHVADDPDLVADLVIAQGQTWLVADGRDGPFVGHSSTWRGAASGTALGVPLFDCGRVMGVLAVGGAGVLQFGAEDVRFLETLSDLLATVLQRARCDEAVSHSQSLKSVGQLAAGVAHDFNNLLTVISGNLQVLQGLPAVAGDAGMRDTVDAAAHAARRGAELTGKLLALGRRQELHPAAVDLGAMLRPFADVLGRTLDRGIRVTVDVAPDCPECLVDPGQLESALLNLAINARDAMPDGGTLSFSAWAAPDVPPDVAARSAAPCDPVYVAIAIADTGAGMSDAVKRRAVEPFFTTKQAGHGTGLGLSTVHGFAQQSNGAMALDSAPGKGTTVTLFLPQHLRA